MPESPGYETLRYRRASISGATYFVTLSTHARARGLNGGTVVGSVKEQIVALESDGTILQHAAVIMPDHLHLLITSLGRLTIGQIVARIKAKTRPAMSGSGLRWQGNYYEYRIRETDRLEEVIRYIFLNSYTQN